jgi:hypothetical protein
MAGQMPEAGADRAPRGIDARNQQQTQRAVDVLLAHQLAVDSGVNEIADEIIAR